MAQIGSPPAGWYTDPSGQNRARFWDGSGWTEEVRYDLTGADTSSAEPGSAADIGRNLVAETVAGVAEAVAAVAASDVAAGFGGNGSGPSEVPDPFARSVTDPFAPVVIDPFGAGAETLPDPSAGPALGWYPDPAGRCQARLWDGTRWTERVADHGVEGIDPLAAVPSSGTVEWPTVQATADPDLSDRATPVMFPGGADPAMSAGQASLLSLPEIGESPSEPRRGHARPTAKIRVAGGTVVGGALALLVGSAMTWMEVRGPRVGDEWTATGLDLGDGRITIALAAVLLVLGVALVSGRMSKFGGARVAAMGALVAGAAALTVAAVDIADVADRAARLGVPAGAVTDVGSGLWVAFVGGLFAAAGGLIAFANRSAR